MNLLRLIFPRQTYHDYLRSLAWRVKRTGALARAGYKCQVCNSAARLEVHHREYTNLFHEHASDLTVLCHDCHQLYHANGRMPTRTTRTRTRTRRTTR